MALAKLAVLIAVFSAGGCLFAKAGPVSVRDACIAKAANYVASVDIGAPVKDLVAASRKFYPDPLTLMTAELSSEYVEAIGTFGSQSGCDKLHAQFENINKEVPCFGEQKLELEEESYLAVMRASPQASNVVEAYFLCEMVMFPPTHELMM